MTKYVSFKIFDSEDHPYGFEGIKDKQVKKNYTWVHEDYYVGIIKAELDRNNIGCIMCKERIANENETYCKRCWKKVLKDITRTETKAQD